MHLRPRARLARYGILSELTIASFTVKVPLDSLSDDKLTWKPLLLLVCSEEAFFQQMQVRRDSDLRTSFRTR